jgi:hypothetical protein
MPHTSLDSARETIALFDRQIAELEEATRQHAKRLESDGRRDLITAAWDSCAKQTRPLRAAREKLVNAVATIVGMTAPPPMIVQKSAQ